MKIPFALCLLGLAVGASAQVGLPDKYKTDPPKPTEVVAKVNGQTITAGDVEALLWEWRGRDATEDLISYLMVSQDAARKGIVISDAEVEKEIDKEMAALAKNQPNAEQILQNNGMSRSRLFLRLKAKLLMDKLVIQDFKPAGYVKVSTILVKTPTSDATAVGEAIKKVQGAYDRLGKGDAWDAVLAATTTEQQAIQVKGLLGWREITAFPESTQKELASLALGGITKPVQTSVGIQLFKLEGKGTDLKGDELAELRKIYMDIGRQAYVQKLRSESKIERLRK